MAAQERNQRPEALRFHSNDRQDRQIGSSRGQGSQYGQKFGHETNIIRRRQRGKLIRIAAFFFLMSNFLLELRGRNIAPIESSQRREVFYAFRTSSKLTYYFGIKYTNEIFLLQDIDSWLLTELMDANLESQLASYTAMSKTMPELKMKVRRLR